MSNQLLDQLLADTYTQSDALNRLRSYKTDVLKQIFGKTETHLKHFTKDNVYQLFDEMEAKIKEIEPLVIYLPSPLADEGTEALGKRVRQTYGKNFLVEIKSDPALLAGCALVWNGVYKDYSLRKKVADNRSKILQLMKEEM